jgi:hypothetical protein
MMMDQLQRHGAARRCTRIAPQNLAIPTGELRPRQSQERHS